MWAQRLFKHLTNPQTLLTVLSLIKEHQLRGFTIHKHLIENRPLVGCVHAICRNSFLRKIITNILKRWSCHESSFPGRWLNFQGRSYLEINSWWQNFSMYCLMKHPEAVAVISRYMHKKLNLIEFNVHNITKTLNFLIRKPFTLKTNISPRSIATVSKFPSQILGP